MMAFFARRPLLWIAAFTSLVFIAACLFWPNSDRLPYSDRFAAQRADEWKPYGGHWHIETDSIVGQAVERGAKLVTGSPSWTDYQVSADVQLRGRGGDSGLVVRVSDAGEGIEAYRGYFVGIRSDDSAIVLGRSTQHWSSTFPVRFPGGVRSGVWFRLHVVAVGCKIAAEATNLVSGKVVFAGLADDSQCLRSGKIALRMTASDGAWRHLHAAVANQDDLQAIAQHLTSWGTLRYPFREQDWNEMRQVYLANVPIEEMGPGVPKESSNMTSIRDSTPLLSIDTLRPHVSEQALVRIVGAVTSTNPVYVQDASAGVRLSQTQNFSFHLGDQVDIAGTPKLEGGSLTFVPEQMRLLWDRGLADPISVTSTQAASGKFNGTFVELSGTLQSREKTDNGQVQLRLHEGAQEFLVRMPQDLFGAASTKYSNGSQLRVRGICATDFAGKTGRLAFILYANSPSDVLYLNGPPWWTGIRLFWIVLTGVALAVLGVWLFVAAERSRTRALFEERQRLSHELHDTLAQSLAGVGFKLQSITQTIQDMDGPHGLMEEVESTYQMVSGTHREASDTIAALHPASQREGDLLTLLERSVFSMLDKETLPVSIQREGEPRTISPAVNDALFRIGREALANVLHHSRATEVSLTLAYRFRDVLLSVQDNGQGFDPNPQKFGFGLRSMQSRAAAIHARLDVLASRGSGCRIQITAPYSAHRFLARWIG